MSDEDSFLLSSFILHTVRDPFADQRGFAKAGGGRDEGQLAVQTRVRRGRRTTLGRGGGI